MIKLVGQSLVRILALFLIHDLAGTLIRLVPAHYVHFALILWYAAKMIPNFKESRLYLRSISPNYFSGDINLVHVPKCGIYT